MTATPPSPSPENPWSRRRWFLALGGLLALYALLLLACLGANAGGSDSSGYLNQAKLLTAGQATVAPRGLPGLPSSPELDFLYSPLGLKPTADHRQLVPTYPLGLPLLLVLARPLFGWAQVANAVAFLHLLAGLALFYAWLRTLAFSRGWALTGAALLALSPLYLRIGTQNMSDVPALVWCLAAMLAAWRADRGAGWSLASGFALGVAVLIRPSNLMLLAPLAFALGPAWRRWLFLVLGGAPLALLQLLHSHAAFGSWLTTGYGAVGGMFSFANVWPSLLQYLRWSIVLFSPVALLALGLPRLGRVDRRLGFVLTTWIAGFFGFYLFYPHTAEAWWFLRFVLPAAPALITAGLWQARAWSWLQTRSPLRYALLALVFAFVVFWDFRLNAFSSGHTESHYPETAAWTKKHLPADAAIFCMQYSGCLFYYTDFTLLRWDAFPLESLGSLQTALRTSGRPVYAVLFHSENQPALARLGGRWTKIGQVRYATIWQAEDFPPPPPLR